MKNVNVSVEKDHVEFGVLQRIQHGLLVLYLMRHKKYFPGEFSEPVCVNDCPQQRCLQAGSRACQSNNVRACEAGFPV